MMGRRRRRRVDQTKKMNSKKNGGPNNNNNSFINISLPSFIIYSGIIIFMWFAFQTLFQILTYNIIKEYQDMDSSSSSKKLLCSNNNNNNNITTLTN